MTKIFYKSAHRYQARGDHLGSEHLWLIADEMYLRSDGAGNAAVRKMNESALDQQTIGNDAMEARASIRGMQIGVRDVRLARAAADLRKQQVVAAREIANRPRSHAETFEVGRKTARNRKTQDIVIGDFAGRVAGDCGGPERSQSASKQNVLPGSELPD